MRRDLCASGEGAGQLVGGLATNAPTSLTQHGELVNDWAWDAGSDSGKDATIGLCLSGLVWRQCVGGRRGRCCVFVAM